MTAEVGRRSEGEHRGLKNAEAREVFDLWTPVFSDFYGVSVANKISPFDLDFSGTVKDFGREKFHMAVKVLEMREPNQPDIIAGFLFISPKGEGVEGRLVEISVGHAMWENARPNVILATTVPIDSVMPMPLNSLQMADCVRQVVFEASQSMVKGVLPPIEQSPLVS